MAKKTLDPQLHAKLVKAEADLEAGRLSRREFHKILSLIGAGAGLSIVDMQPAYAWVATRMRKRKTTAVATLGAASSLRFDGSSSAWLSRTPSSTGSRRKFTFSAWVKRGALGGQRRTLWGSAPAGVWDYFAFAAGDQLVISFDPGNAAYTLTTGAVYRDSSAWAHVVIAVDTTLSTASERVRIFYNGVRQATTGTIPPQNYDTTVNVSGNKIAVGAELNYANTSGTQFFDGVMNEVYLLDGQVQEPSAFAQTDATTGVWTPKQYAGSFGTNGFYLPFKSNTAASGTGTSSGTYPGVTGVSGLGADFSGNGNHLAASAINVFDQLLDCPSNNFCVPHVERTERTYWTYSRANLRALGTSGTYMNNAWGSYALSSGKWYWEVTVGGVATWPMIGINPDNGVWINSTNNTAYGYYYCASGQKTVNGSQFAYGATYAAGDVIGVALDLNSNQITFYKNNASQGAIAIPAGTYNPAGAMYNGQYIEFNSGQGGQSGLTVDAASGGLYKYTAPSGYKALSSTNLSTPAILKPSQYFGVATYTGNGGTQRVGDVIPPTAGYAVSKSLRLNASNSAALSRTPSANGSATTWTWSVWVKRTSTQASGSHMLFSEEVGAGAITGLSFYNDAIYFAFANSATYLITNPVFTNVAEWMHVMAVADSTQATASNRLKIYVNGTQITSFSTANYPAQNAVAQSQFNSTSAVQYVGRNSSISPSYANLLMADVYFLDGIAATPSSFGQVDAASGDWVPSAYGGSYGTNGYYLNFSDSSATTAGTLGKDYSGNGNNWTPTGFAMTDFLLDTPTKNFMTLDPNRKGSGETVSGGNLVASGNAGHDAVYGTFTVPTSGSYYVECTVGSTTSSVSAVCLGLARTDHSPSAADHVGNTVGIGSYYASSSIYIGNPDGTAISMGGTFSAGDVLQLASQWPKVWLGKNNVWLDGSGGSTGNPSTGANPTFTVADGFSYYLFVNTYSNTATINFGQGGIAGTTFDASSGGSYKYTPPTGFKTMSVNNFPTTSGANQFAPDLVWIKCRSNGMDSAWYDTSRGVMQDLCSNNQTMETTQVTGLTSFTKTGFAVGGLAKVNTSGNTYASWMWKKGATPGFDAVAYTGNGSSQNISHSLGATPEFYITKARSDNTGYSWNAWHTGLTAGVNSYIAIDGASAQLNGVNLWNGGSRSSTTFGVSYPANNLNGQTYIAYLWRSVDGFSRIGTYNGNGGSDGAFIWCGFRPAWIMCKRIDSADDWIIFDNARDPINQGGHYLRNNLASAEGTAASYIFDFFANGFKARGSASSFNASGGVFIFMAFAEAPFKNARAR